MDDLSGILLMIINASKLNILDIKDTREISRIYGEGINKIIRESESYSFYLLVAFLIDEYFKKYDLSSIKKIMNDFNISDPKSIKILLKIEAILKKSKTKSATDEYAAKIFMPMAAEEKYNCILEWEEYNFDGQYVLLSDEMLKGKCCKFIPNTQLKKLSDKQKYMLNHMNIYDNNTIKTVLTMFK
jgi:hypothetical protein